MNRAKAEEMIIKFQTEINREINRKPIDYDFIKVLEDRIRELKLSLQ